MPPQTVPKPQINPIHQVYRSLNTHPHSKTWLNLHTQPQINSTPTHQKPSLYFESQTLLLLRIPQSLLVPLTQSKTLQRHLCDLQTQKLPKI